jgi:hypothetical protein
MITSVSQTKNKRNFGFKLSDFQLEKQLFYEELPNFVEQIFSLELISARLVKLFTINGTEIFHIHMPLFGIR